MIFLGQPPSNIQEFIDQELAKSWSSYWIGDSEYFIDTTDVNFQTLPNSSEITKFVLAPMANIVPGGLVGCTNIEEISIMGSDSSLSDIADFQFLRTINANNIKIITTRKYAGNQCLENFNAEKALKIEAGAFKHCRNLKNLNIPSVEEIEGDPNYENLITRIGGTFESCSSLTEVELPNIKTIGEYAFVNCIGLSNLNISNVNYIRPYAFSGCSNLETIDATNLKELYKDDLGNTPFRNCGKLKSIHVDAYKIESTDMTIYQGLRSLPDSDGNIDSIIVRVSTDSHGNIYNAKLEYVVPTIQHLETDAYKISYGCMTDSANLESIKITGAAEIDIWAFPAGDPITNKNKLKYIDFSEYKYSQPPRLIAEASEYYGTPDIDQLVEFLPDDYIIYVSEAKKNMWLNDPIWGTLVDHIQVKN